MNISNKQFSENSMRDIIDRMNEADHIKEQEIKEQDKYFEFFDKYHIFGGVSFVINNKRDTESVKLSHEENQLLLEAISLISPDKWKIAKTYYGLSDVKAEEKKTEINTNHIFDYNETLRNDKYYYDVTGCGHYTKYYTSYSVNCPIDNWVKYKWPDDTVHYIGISSPRNIDIPQSRSTEGLFRKHYVFKLARNTGAQEILDLMNGFCNSIKDLMVGDQHFTYLKYRANSWDDDYSTAVLFKDGTVFGKDFKNYTEYRFKEYLIEQVRYINGDAALPSF